MTAVLLIRCTASAATSAGSTTRLMGSVARSWARRLSRSAPSRVADSGLSTKPAAMRLTRIGAISTARLATRAGSAAEFAAMSDSPGRPPAAAGAGHEQQRAAGPHPADGLLGHGDRQPDVMVPIELPPVVLQLGQRRVVRAGAGDQHVVDRSRQAAEEAAERGLVGGVKRRGIARADLGRGLLQAVGVPAGDDHAGALLGGQAGGFHSDAGAAADHDDGLSGELRFAGHDITSWVIAIPLPARAGARPRSGRAAPSARPRRSPRR